MKPSQIGRTLRNTQLLQQHPRRFKAHRFSLAINRNLYAVTFGESCACEFIGNLVVYFQAVFPFDDFGVDGDYLTECCWFGVADS